MAIRNDTTINLNVSPRILTINKGGAQDTEISLQDLSDTLRHYESLPVAMGHSDLLVSDGKQDLDGGVYVGITSTLKNVKVAFETRTASVGSGTITTANVEGIQLIDSAATFQTNGVKVGALIINLDDGSVGTVITVDSEIQLTHALLEDGTENDWDIGEKYKIWNIVQCEVSGGNLVAVDDNEVSMSPITPTAFTQVVKTSSSSATLQEIDAILYASYQNAVWIDVINGTSGTVKGVGSRETPSDNVSDAVSIAQDLGFGILAILGNITLDGSGDISGFRIQGEDCLLTSVTVEGAANVSETKFSSCFLQGTLNGDNVVENCRVGNLTYISGCFVECIMVGNLILSSGVYGNLFHCVSGVPGTTFTIDMGGAGQSLGIIGHNGDFEIKNMTNSNDIANINILSGKVTLADTVTLGQVTIGGVEIDNKAASAVTVNMESILIPDSAYNGKVHIDVANGTFGTIRPFGTATKPVKTVTDAITIATLYNFSEYCLKGMIIAPQNFEQTKFVGGSSATNDIIVASGQSFSNSNFEKLTITGTIIGVSHQFENCLLSNLTGVNGILVSCGLLGTIKVLAGSTFSARDAVFMSTPTIIDLDNSNAQVIIVAKAGIVKFINAGTGSLIQMICDEVTIELDSSCTAGIAQLWGVGTVVNNSTMTVIDNTTILNLVGDEACGKREIVNNQEIFYKADNVTEIMRFALKDKDGNPTMENVYSRERL